MAKAIVGVIGGTGVYALEGLQILRVEKIDTPWGEPSDQLRFGRIGHTDCIFLARHGQGHRHSPSSINYRANIDALKRAGATDIVAISACGSYKRELYPGLFVFIDQLIDRTFARQTSFFGSGCVAHVPFAHPISPNLRERFIEAARAEGIAYHPTGTYVCMEGPQFSTLAESRLYQALDVDVVGMTVATEAKLAREAELPYAAIAMVTDYDCWHEELERVDVAAVMKVMQANSARAHALVRRVLLDFPEEHDVCRAGSDTALDSAIMTAPEARDPALVAKLDAVARRVLSADK
jgi:5'-methylthioadenosine phosphorylase